MPNNCDNVGELAVSLAQRALNKRKTKHAVALAEELCPEHAVDGGYGTADPGHTYRCPACQEVWLYTPNLAAAMTHLDRLLEQGQVADARDFASDLAQEHGDLALDRDWDLAG